MISKLRQQGATPLGIENALNRRMAAADQMKKIRRLRSIKDVGWRNQAIREITYPGRVPYSRGTRLMDEAILRARKLK